jgi:hypothetical protein
LFTLSLDKILVIFNGCNFNNEIVLSIPERVNTFINGQAGIGVPLEQLSV